MPVTKPADRKPAKQDLEHFSFEYDGKTYTFEGSFGRIARPGFIRKNRNKSEIDLIFTMLEEIAGDDALAAIDEMDTDEFKDFAEQFDAAWNEYQGASVGES